MAIRLRNDLTKTLKISIREVLICWIFLCFGMRKRKNRDVWLFPDQMKQSSHNYFTYLPANSNQQFQTQMESLSNSLLNSHQYFLLQLHHCRRFLPFNVSIHFNLSTNYHNFFLKINLFVKLTWWHCRNKMLEGIYENDYNLQSNWFVCFCHFDFSYNINIC